MDFSARPEGLFERIALWLNLGPVPLVQGFFGMTAARTLMAGVRLGVFAALAERPASLETLASRLKLQPRGLELLLGSLASLGHVQKKDERYGLHPRARKWLDPRSKHYVGGFLEFNYVQWEWWGRLEDVLRGGEPEEIHDWPEDDPRWGPYIRAMFEMARIAAPEVAARVPLPRRPRRLLDIGGAHGWFAAELCRRHRGLDATVLDLPGSVRVGRALLAGAGVERVAFREGDALEVELGGPYDGVLIGQLMHHLNPAQNRALLARVHGALAPGGTVALIEFLREDGGTAVGSAAMIGLHYHLTSAAQNYTLAETKELLHEAGFTRARARRIRRLPLQTLITARR